MTVYFKLYGAEWSVDVEWEGDPSDFTTGKVEVEGDIGAALERGDLLSDIQIATCEALHEHLEAKAEMRRETA